MSLLKRLFGKTPATEPDPEEYNGYLIFASPAHEGGSFRINARIEKEIDGEVKTHTMIRADTYGSSDVAAEMSLLKAKALIDQQGERIFG